MELECVEFRERIRMPRCAYMDITHEKPEPRRMEPFLPKRRG